MNKQLTVPASSRRTTFSSLLSLLPVSALALVAVTSTTACTGDDDAPATTDDTGTTTMDATDTGMQADGGPAMGTTGPGTTGPGTAGDGQDESTGSGPAVDDTSGDSESGSDTAGDSESGSDTAGGSESGSTGGEGIEIAGVWIETYGGTGMLTHTIDDTMWEQDDSNPAVDTFAYTLTSFDNATRTAIGDDPAFGFAKLQWTWIDGGAELYYCTVATGFNTAEAAAAAPDADATDPATGGCGVFPWSLLMPSP